MDKVLPLQERDITKLRKCLIMDLKEMIIER